MKKNLLYALIGCLMSTFMLANEPVLEKSDFLEKNFVAPVASNYDANDIYGILKFYIQYSEDTHKWNYEQEGLIWDDMTKAIEGYPENILTKLSHRLEWKKINSNNVLIKLYLNSIDYEKFSGEFLGKYFKNLKYLNCSSNLLTSLDLSKNTELEFLKCSSNQLTSLDLSKNKKLEYLNCSSNNLTQIDLSKNVNLSSIYCVSNKLNDLDLSKNIKLKELDCSKNQLEALEIRKNLNLEYLKCNSNQIKELNLSENPNLKLISCELNKLTSLNVNNNVNLQYLYCSSNQLTNLDLSMNVLLKELNCSYNQFQKLNVSKNIYLENLNCSINEIIELNIDNCKYLKELNCDSNNLSKLDVSENNELCSLSCSYNQLTNLDVTNNLEMIELNCSSNKIKSLSIPNNPRLYSLTGYKNQLKFSTLEGNYLPIKYLKLNPQEILQGGIKEFNELIDISSEYDIKGTFTSYNWYDKARNKKVNMLSSEGTFYAGRDNAGKSLICKMENKLFPGFILEYEVDIKKIDNSLGIIEIITPSENTSDSNISLSKLINVVPNPIIDIVKISTPVKIIEATVFDLTGKEVQNYSRIIDNELDLQNLSKGIYMILIKTEKGTVSKKIIKK